MSTIPPNGTPRPARVFHRAPAALRTGDLRDRDPGADLGGLPPNLGEDALPHVLSFQGLLRSIAKVYQASDEAIRHSRENARFMRNDAGIMECLEQRRRSTALLDWRLVPEDEKSPKQKRICEVLTTILQGIPRFMQYRECLLDALWYGKSAVQQRYRWRSVRGRMRLAIDRWLPVHGDKIVFRYDDGAREWNPDQVGIRVGAGLHVGQSVGRWKVERVGKIGVTDYAMAYFLENWERPLLTIHKHMIEDGEFEAPERAGRVHGVGIRDRIYWLWYQKQESTAWLMEYLERSAFGIEVWSYPAGNEEAYQRTRTAAQERIGNARNILLVPRHAESSVLSSDVKIVEPGMAGAEVLERILREYFGWQIKRYILGQTLTTETAGTGLGSNLASIHLDTYLQIVRYDARNLEETLTEELVRPLLGFNFPGWAECPIRFRIQTEAPDVDAKLSGWQRAYEMGLAIPAQELADLIAVRRPESGEAVLRKGSGGDGERGREGATGVFPAPPLPGDPSPSLSSPGISREMEPREEFHARGERVRYAGAWDPKQHPRGNPENAGEFREKDPSRPTIEIRGDEFGSGATNEAIRQRALEHWREHLKGRKFRNAHTGRDIQLSRDGIAKALSFSGDIARAKLIAAFPQLVHEAAYEHTEPAHKPRSKYRQYHYFTVDATVEGEEKTIDFVVGEDPNGNWFYQFSRIAQRERPAPSQGPRFEPDGLPGNGGPSTGIVRPGEDEVQRNSRRGEVLPYRADWDEAKHPRGQPENAGQFAEKPEGEKGREGEGEKKPPPESIPLPRSPSPAPSSDPRAAWAQDARGRAVANEASGRRITLLSDWLETIASIAVVGLLATDVGRRLFLAAAVAGQLGDVARKGRPIAPPPGPQTQPGVHRFRRRVNIEGRWHTVDLVAEKGPDPGAPLVYRAAFVQPAKPERETKPEGEKGREGEGEKKKPPKSPPLPRSPSPSLRRKRPKEPDSAQALWDRPSEGGGDAVKDPAAIGAAWGKRPKPDAEKPRGPAGSTSPERIEIGPGVTMTVAERREKTTEELAAEKAARKQRRKESFADLRRATHAEAKQNLRRIAAQYEIRPDDLRDAAQFVHREKAETIRERERAKAQARQITGLTAGDLARIENAGHDYATGRKVGGATGAKLARFDEWAIEVARQHPGLIGDADDPDANLPEKLWDLIREGKREIPSIHDPDLLREAAELIVAQGGAQGELVGAAAGGSEEEIPFARAHRERVERFQQWRADRAFAAAGQGERYAKPKPAAGQKSIEWNEKQHPRNEEGEWIEKEEEPKRSAKPNPKQRLYEASRSAFRQHPRQPLDRGYHADLNPKFPPLRELLDDARTEGWDRARAFAEIDAMGGPEQLAANDDRLHDQLYRWFERNKQLPDDISDEQWRALVGPEVADKIQAAGDGQSTWWEDRLADFKKHVWMDTARMKEEIAALAGLGDGQKEPFRRSGLVERFARAFAASGWTSIRYAQPKPASSGKSSEINLAQHRAGGRRTRGRTE